METFGNVSDRLMAASRSTVVKTEFSVSDLFNIGLHPVHIVDLDTPIHVCQQFGCYNARKDQNATCSRTEETSVPDTLTDSAEIVLPSPPICNV